MLENVAAGVDSGLDNVGIVEHAFHEYDAITATGVLNHRVPTYMPQAKALQEDSPANTSHIPNVHTNKEHLWNHENFIDNGIDVDGMDDCHSDEVEEDNVELFKDAEGDDFFGESNKGMEENPELHWMSPFISEQVILEDKVSILLFVGSQLTSLGATLILYNLCQTHGTSNLFISKLFTILSCSILPVINTMPRLEHFAPKRLKSLGLMYKSIHACPNNCCLLRGEAKKDLKECPDCKAPRYKQVGDIKVLLKVLQYFPLIPRLKQMFATPLQASLQIWHIKNRSIDGLVHHVADSRQWEEAHKINPGFSAEHRNLRLDLATNGVNPFSIKHSTWSTWPILIFNYNIPPWMTTKCHFIILSMVIPDPQSVTNVHFDVFMEPLIEKLLELWEVGVETVDTNAYRGSSNFNLRAILLWTMHDFPAYGIESGLVTKGFLGCPVCGPNTISRRSIALAKMFGIACIGSF